jgi:hypothetical protein
MRLGRRDDLICDAEIVAVPNRLGPTATIKKLVADGELTDSRAERWLAELREDAATGTLVAGVCGFVVSGQRP